MARISNGTTLHQCSQGICFDLLTQEDCNELIEKKLEKKPIDSYASGLEEKISIENGRWGPFIRFGKKMLKLAAGPNGKYSPEELADISLDEIKKIDRPGSQGI